MFRTAEATMKRIDHPGDDSELFDLTADPGELDNLLVPNTEPASWVKTPDQRAAAVAAADSALSRRSLLAADEIGPQEGRARLEALTRAATR
ncbi:MAG: hypothetical protein R2695_19505 [Acidimicrobiales bacterium]